MITERDLKILKYIDRFYYSTSKTIQDIYFNDLKGEGKRVKCNERLRKMAERGLLLFEKDMLNRTKVYRLSSKGKNFLRKDTEGDSRNTMRWGRYFHNLGVQNVLIEFKNFGINSFISEKEWVSETGMREATPDLIVVNAKGEYIFIEVERELKRYKTLREKLLKYESIDHLRAVLYVCKNDPITEKLFKIKKEIKPSFELFSFPEVDFFTNSSEIIKEVMNV